MNRTDSPSSRFADWWHSRRLTWILIVAYLGWVAMGWVTGWDRLRDPDATSTGRAVFLHTDTDKVEFFGSFVPHGIDFTSHIRFFEGSAELEVSVAQASQLSFLVECMNADYDASIEIDNRTTGRKVRLIQLYRRQVVLTLEVQAGHNDLRIVTSDEHLRYRFKKVVLTNAANAAGPSSMPSLDAIDFTSVDGLDVAVGSGWSQGVPLHAIEPDALLPSTSRHSHLRFMPPQPGRYRFALRYNCHLSHPPPTVAVNGRLANCSYTKGDNATISFTAELNGPTILTFRQNARVKPPARILQGGISEFPRYNIWLSGISITPAD